MVVSAQHFREVTNGYEQITSGLWTHKGRMDAGGLRATDSSTPPSGVGLELNYNPPGNYGYINSYDRTNSQWRDLYLNAKNLALQPQGGTFQVNGGKQTISYDAGLGPTYTPALEVSTPQTATGAGAFVRFVAGTWQTMVGTVAGTWWHLFADGGGTPSWGWDGSHLRLPTEWQNIAYQNGFSAIAGWGPCQYMKTPDGTVRFRGLLNCPSGWTHGTAAFTMPAGYALAMEAGSPGYHHYGCYSNGPNGNGQGGITVWGSGVVSPWMGPNGTAGTAGQWFDLGNLSYRAY